MTDKPNSELRIEPAIERSFGEGHLNAAPGVTSPHEFGTRIAALHHLAGATADGYGGSLAERPYFRSALAALELEWLVLQAVRQRVATSSTKAATLAVASRLETALALRIAELTGEIAGPEAAADRRGLGHNAGAFSTAEPGCSLHHYAGLLAAAGAAEATSAAEIAAAILGEAIPD